MLEEKNFGKARPILVGRQQVQILPQALRKHIATKVRQMILKGGEETLTASVPTCVADNAVILKHFIKTFQEV